MENNHRRENSFGEDFFDGHVRLARELDTQALLFALYERCEDTPRFIQDFDRSISQMNVFYERRRLASLLNNLGEMILLATDICWERGIRSNGHDDLSLREMRDLAVQSLEEGLKRAKRFRAASSHLETTLDQ